MNHNCSAVMAVHPFRRNDAVYQKTFLVNDFYLTGGPDGAPLGNMQLLGKVSGRILAAAGGVPAAGGGLARGPRGRLLRDERGPARPAQPGHGRGRADRARLAAVELGGARGAGGEAQGGAATGRLPPGAVEALRPAHALAPVRDGANGDRPGDERRRHLLPGARPPEPLRRRRELPADLGGGEPGADHRRAGAAHRPTTSSGRIWRHDPSRRKATTSSSSAAARRAACWRRGSPRTRPRGCCCSRRAGATGIPFYHLPAGFAKMTKGIGSWGW